MRKSKQKRRQRRQFPSPHEVTVTSIDHYPTPGGPFAAGLMTTVELESYSYFDRLRSTLRGPVTYAIDFNRSYDDFRSKNPGKPR